MIAKSDIKNRKGTHWKKMVAFLNRHGKRKGFYAKTVYGNIGLLKKHIASGLPVIVRQWKNPSKPFKHYRVVVGYNERKRTITYHDPAKGSYMRMGYSLFNELWDIKSQGPKWTSKNLMIIITRR